AARRSTPTTTSSKTARGSSSAPAIAGRSKNCSRVRMWLVCDSPRRGGRPTVAANFPPAERRMTGANEAPLPRWHAGTGASGGEDISYEATEPASPAATILLTHGAGGSHAIWYQQVVAFAQGYRVITWDTRGFGNSTFRSGTHGPHAAADDMRAVLDATGTE